MKKNKPDLSNHEVSLDLLASIFPQLSMFAGLGGGKKKYTRANALSGLLLQLFVALLTAAAFFLVMVVVAKYADYFPGSGKNNLLISLVATFIGLPAMMIILVSFNNAFDLFYLLITGIQFDKGGDSIKLVKIVMLVCGFVGSLFLAGYSYFEFSMYRLKQSNLNELAAEQKEHFLHLDKGREAWNSYITSGPMHRIDFSGADLSKRSFNGFFFQSVKFNNCNLTDTVFDNCYLSYAQFNNAICLRTCFKNSYLRAATFKDADLTKVDMSGAFAVKADFNEVKIDADQVSKLLKPDKSSWHEVGWFDYHTDEWLQKNNYGSGRRSKGLKY